MAQGLIPTCTDNTGTLVLYKHDVGGIPLDHTINLLQDVVQDLLQVERAAHGKGPLVQCLGQLTLLPFRF